MSAGIARAGLLLPESILQSDWFSALATFVAVNTLIYVAFAAIKIFPAPRFTRGRGRSRRVETRSIHPDGEV